MCRRAKRNGHALVLIEMEVGDVSEKFEQRFEVCQDLEQIVKNDGKVIRIRSRNVMFWRQVLRKPYEKTSKGTLKEDSPVWSTT